MSERIVRELAVKLMNQYTKRTDSRTKWLKHPAVQLDWTLSRRDENQRPYEERRKSLPFSLSTFENELARFRRFDHSKFNLPDLRDGWLDATVDVAPMFHLPSADGRTALTVQATVPLGPSFPLMPRLDREGRGITSFQGILLARISSLRERLVVRSEAPHHDEWFQDLRSIIGECVSLIDATLHQLYFKAQYDPVPGWSFDRAVLGQRHGQRLADKLRWVRMITGRDLNAPGEVLAFKRLKKLRNHLEHFDPPCFCYTFEDAAGWLNDVLSVGRLNLRIRECASAQVSSELVVLLLQHRVEFAPVVADQPRIPQPSQVGYGSVVWLSDERDDDKGGQ